MYVLTSTAQFNEISLVVSAACGVMFMAAVIATILGSRPPKCTNCGKRYSRHAKAGERLQCGGRKTIDPCELHVEHCYWCLLSNGTQTSLYEAELSEVKR